MTSAEQSIAQSERNVRVINAMKHAMVAMQLIELAEVKVEGAHWKLNFSSQILGLKEALYLMGQETNQ